MVAKEQVKRTEDFLALHHDPKLLVLPNIWDPLGARLLEALDYPAVATASAAVAFSSGYNDGQKINFTTMLEVIQRIAHSVQVPLTADIEGGFAMTPDDVAENIREVIRAGAVGINFEDGTFEGDEPLHPLDFQCERIQAVRKAADNEGLPLVINAMSGRFHQAGTGIRGRENSRDDQASQGLSRGRCGLYLSDHDG